MLPKSKRRDFCPVFPSGKPQPGLHLLMPASNEIHWNQSGSEGQTETHTTNLGIIAHFYTESLRGCKRRLSLRSTHEPCAPCKRERGNQPTIPLALAPSPHRLILFFHGGQFSSSFHCQGHWHAATGSVRAQTHTHTLADTCTPKHRLTQSSAVPEAKGSVPYSYF